MWYRCIEARIVEESPDELLIEATGTGPFMVSLLRALEPFGILDLARSGPMVVPGPSPASQPASLVHRPRRPGSRRHSRPEYQSVPTFSILESR